MTKLNNIELTKEENKNKEEQKKSYIIKPVFRGVPRLLARQVRMLPEADSHFVGNVIIITKDKALRDYSQSLGFPAYKRASKELFYTLLKKGNLEAITLLDTPSEQAMQALEYIYKIAELEGYGIDIYLGTKENRFIWHPQNTEAITKDTRGENYAKKKEESKYIDSVLAENREYFSGYREISDLDWQKCYNLAREYELVSERLSRWEIIEQIKFYRAHGIKPLKKVCPDCQELYNPKAEHICPEDRFIRISRKISQKEMNLKFELELRQ